MIRFKTINVDGRECDWEFETVAILEREWWNPDCWLPANDDPLLAAEVDGQQFEIPNGAWFEDLLTMVGIDIWVATPPYLE